MKNKRLDTWIERMTKHLTVTWDIKLIITQLTYKTVIYCCDFQRSPKRRSPFQLWWVLVSFYSQTPPLGHWWAIPIIDGDVTPCFDGKRHVYDNTSSHPPPLPLLFSTPRLRPLVIKLSSNWYNIWTFRRRTACVSIRWKVEYGWR